MTTTATGCPSCQGGAVISTGRNASGSWKCMSCGHAFSDFGAAPTVTVYAVRQDEPAAQCDIWGNPIAPTFARNVWHSTPGAA